MQVDKSTSLKRTVDDSPTRLAAPDRSLGSVDNGLGSNDRKRQHAPHLCQVLALIDRVPSFNVLEGLGEGVRADAVKVELGLDAALEGVLFFRGQGVGLGDDGNDVGDFGKLPHDGNVDGAEAVRQRGERRRKYQSTTPKTGSKQSTPTHDHLEQ